MERLHKNTVKSTIRKNGVWKGYLVANKVSEFHIKNGWNLGCLVEVNDLEELEKHVNAFSYYNCNSELGQRVAFYSEN